jgi:hypothetical protein
MSRVRELGCVHERQVRSEGTAAEGNGGAAHFSIYSALSREEVICSSGSSLKVLGLLGSDSILGLSHVTLPSSKHRTSTHEGVVCVVSAEKTRGCLYLYRPNPWCPSSSPRMIDSCQFDIER